MTVNIVSIFQFILFLCGTFLLWTSFSETAVEAPSLHWRQGPISGAHKSITMLSTYVKFVIKFTCVTIVNANFKYLMATNLAECMNPQNLEPTHVLNNWKNLHVAQMPKVCVKNCDAHKFDHKLNICGSFVMDLWAPQSYWFGGTILKWWFWAFLSS
jgi:hypothetical protein